MNSLEIQTESKVAEVFAQQSAFYLAGKSRSVQHRKAALKKLKALLKSNQKLMDEAIYADFQKGSFDNFSTELAFLYEELSLNLKHLEKWMEPGSVPTNLATIPGKSWIQPEPYGTSLVIGAWNYPYQLTLGPVIPAIAAGNTVMIKPSELAPHSSAVMASIINNNFDPSFLYVQEGGVEEAQQLLAQPFDKIFFTGSTRVGKIVLKAGAEHLSNVTLELGGKSPCFVFPDANIKLAAKRIAWGKFLNGGQTCIAPDYLVVHENVKEKLIKELRTVIQTMYGQDASASDAYVQIINDDHFKRLVQLIDPQKVVIGGEHDQSKRFIAPTVLDGVEWSDEIMEEEIFGPLLPVITYSDLEAAKKLVRSKGKPLAFYVFTGSSGAARKLTRDIPFGGCTINDTVMHFANHHLPFGGVGGSGVGAYHGKAGFACFSNHKSILKKATWFDPFMRYPPYTDFKRKLLTWLLG